MRSFVLLFAGCKPLAPVLNHVHHMHTEGPIRKFGEEKVNIDVPVPQRTAVFEPSRDFLVRMFFGRALSQQARSMGSAFGAAGRGPTCGIFKLHSALRHRVHMSGLGG